MNTDSSVIIKDSFPDVDYHIIGCGAVGSFLTYFLPKSGKIRNLHIWDFDIVEDVNITTQFPGIQHIGMKKTDAVEDCMNFMLLNEEDYNNSRNNIPYYSPINIIKHEKYTDEPLSGIIFIAVDDTRTRINILKKCLDSFEVTLIVCVSLPYLVYTSDMSAQVITIPGSDYEGIQTQIDEYENYLTNIHPQIMKEYNEALAKIKACRTQNLAVLSAGAAIKAIIEVIKYFDIKKVNLVREEFEMDLLPTNRTVINFNLY